MKLSVDRLLLLEEVYMEVNLASALFSISINSFSAHLNKIEIYCWPFPLRLFLLINATKRIFLSSSSSRSFHSCTTLSPSLIFVMMSSLPLFCDS